MKNTILFLFTMCSVFSLIAEESNQEIDVPMIDEAEESSSLMPTYGNWCGLNHPKSPENAGDPIDILDGICKQHDICYLERGHMDCGCDSEFNESVVLNINKFTRSEKLFARTFRIYFRGSPCYGDQKDKIAPTRVFTTIAEKTNARTRQILNRAESSVE
ncbi:MAG: hypothetical protein ABW139_17680 [Candidatus Thiodiazotropha sp. DIVDIV]